MGGGKYATSRQRACEACVRAKTRCKSTPVGCARCITRRLTCSLPFLSGENQSQIGDNVVDGNILVLPQAHSGVDDRLEIGVTQTSSIDSSPTSENATASESQAVSRTSNNNPDINSVESSNPCLESSALTDGDLKGTSNRSEPESISSPCIMSSPYVDIELICTINAKDIRNRWLNAFAPEPGQTTKEYPKHVVSFIFRMLKSYTATIVRGSDLPPFMHPFNTESPAIERCLTLVQTCTRLSGFTASLLAQVLEDEVNKTYSLPDFPNLRSEFQANLIYMMVLFFCYAQDDDAKTLFRRGIVNLQELASRSTETGIICLAERDGVRPRWEAWIAAETQRRSIYLMYMFDNLLSAKDGLQTFLGTELRGLPAPSAKDLWYARSRQEWETCYNNHLLAKTIPGISIDDLWPLSTESHAAATIKARQRKVDRWLEGIDEFGTMLYAVTCCTHGD